MSKSNQMQLKVNKRKSYNGAQEKILKIIKNEKQRKKNVSEETMNKRQLSIK